VTSVKEVFEVLKNAKTEREIERALRDSEIFSKSNALHLISVIKSTLRDSEPRKDDGESVLPMILDSMKQMTKNIGDVAILNSLRQIKL